MGVHEEYLKDKVKQLQQRDEEAWTKGYSAGQKNAEKLAEQKCKQLQQRIKELENAEILLNNIIEAYCLINPANPNKDDIDRLYEQLKIANDSLVEG